ncbi:hypothetical protein EYC80_008254, partial [Monilinia laxa]
MRQTPYRFVHYCRKIRRKLQKYKIHKSIKNYLFNGNVIIIIIIIIIITIHQPYNHPPTKSPPYSLYLNVVYPIKSRAKS